MKTPERLGLIYALLLLWSYWQQQGDRMVFYRCIQR